MSLRFFEGPAGSGKTTRLFEDLSATLQERPLGQYERVLALTKMHGSRRRMQGRLIALPRLFRKFECTTIDSFAWRVFRRWRTLARAKGMAELLDNDYEAVCRAAGALLADRIVQRWTTRCFPVVVIDEMQDSKNSQLGIVRALSNSAICLAAADEYQDLEGSVENDSVVWGQENGEVVSLTDNYRTTATGLLAAASAVRNCRVVPHNGSGFVVLAAHNHNGGAGLVSRNLTWWHDSNDIALISPVRTDSSSFVRNLIRRVEQGPIGSPAVGPHRIPWEVSEEDECEHFLSSLTLPTETSVEVCASELSLDCETGSLRALRLWFDQQRRLTGKTNFKVSEIQQQARLIHQRSRAFRRTRDRGVRAMTIHQAKNREFDSVIVLWPYKVAGAPERQRRLLYNAITRARRRAVVIVQNPARLNRPPFVP